ncbi:carbon-nitrogen hydrolase family protein [Halomonas caseinilytica]|uniref:carbon-nitrogen hydrolase family protein n=1 Tax=Halomonas caseinilytica TaxID=438744 RepID=UPI0007E587D3|nr:carbon-nitrogen hydrolase family protein [Halomonas caseinilytica]SEN40772.1 Predicted amidohydrolase [Halomonas caseinilytica]
MRVCVAQLRPEPGDLAKNTEKHLALIKQAVVHRADVVYFPELSLTGYQPRLSSALVSDAEHWCLNELQELSDAHGLQIGVGMPLVVDAGVQIGMVWFLPHEPPRTYAKQWLHASELAYFTAGDHQLLLDSHGGTLAPAICYESLQADHANAAAEMGARFYLASVAESASNLPRAMQHYSSVARRHSMHVLLADAVGPSGDFISTGRSAAWNTEGELLAQMGTDSEGVLILDTAQGIASVHEVATS